MPQAWKKRWKSDSRVQLPGIRCFYLRPAPALTCLRIMSTEGEFSKILSGNCRSSMGSSGRFDYWLLFSMLTLVVIGVVMVYSSSGFMAQNKYNDQLYFFKKQLMWLLLALPFFILATRLNY